MSERLQVRAATKDHWKRISHVDSLCFNSNGFLATDDVAFHLKKLFGIVASLDGEVVGYAMYDLRNEINLMRIVVAPEFQRLGIGSRLLTRVKQNGKIVTCNAPDDNLDLHLFLQANGFVATRGENGKFTQTTKDQSFYCFKYAR